MRKGELRSSPYVSEPNTVMNQNNHSNCRCEREKLRAINFAIQETVLYLDAYPCHPEALCYYHALIEEREKLLASYEKHCGPMTMYGNTSRDSWDWVKGPWPWEPDAN